MVLAIFWYSLTLLSSLGFKRDAYSWVEGLLFGKKGEGLLHVAGWFFFVKEGDCCSLGLLAAHLGKRKGQPPSLLAFIPPLKIRGECLVARYLWFLSLFWVILGWFLFQLSPKIGWSNTNFCWVLWCRYRFRNQQRQWSHFWLYFFWCLHYIYFLCVIVCIISIVGKNLVAADAKIINAMQHISTVDDEIISAHNLLLTKKLLTKTMSLMA